MIPFLVLVVATLAFRGVGAAGVAVLDSWAWSLRAGLCVMFLLTASAHWGKRRPALIAMVPRAFSRPDRMVTITGILEYWAPLDCCCRGLREPRRRAWRRC